MKNLNHKYTIHRYGKNLENEVLMCETCHCWEGSAMSLVPCRTDWTANEILALKNIDEKYKG